MKVLSFNKTYTISKTGSERGELLDKFLDRLNPSRREAGYKPLTPAALNVKLAHIPTEDLYAFYKQCEQAKHFSKYFWWAIKATE